MSTAMHHYMMDCYYPDATKADGARRETNQIKAIGARGSTALVGIAPRHRRQRDRPCAILAVAVD